MNRWALVHGRCGVPVVYFAVKPKDGTDIEPGNTFTPDGRALAHGEPLVCKQCRWALRLSELNQIEAVN